MRLTSDDALATLTIWQEAAGEAYAGKRAVADVIRNRMRRKYGSDGTVAGTVAAAFQFSAWNSTKDPNISGLRIASLQLDDANPVVLDCSRAWQESALGPSTVGDAVLYVNPKAVVKMPTWATQGKLQAVVGRHNFYRSMKRTIKGAHRDAVELRSVMRKGRR